MVPRAVLFDLLTALLEFLDAVGYTCRWERGDGQGMAGRILAPDLRQRRLPCLTKKLVRDAARAVGLPDYMFRRRWRSAGPN